MVLQYGKRVFRPRRAKAKILPTVYIDLEDNGSAADIALVKDGEEITNAGTTEDVVADVELRETSKAGGAKVDSGSEADVWLVEDGKEITNAGTTEDVVADVDLGETSKAGGAKGDSGNEVNVALVEDVEEITNGGITEDVVADIELGETSKAGGAKGDSGSKADVALVEEGEKITNAGTTEDVVADVELGETSKAGGAKGDRSKTGKGEKMKRSKEGDAEKGKTSKKGTGEEQKKQKPKAKYDFLTRNSPKVLADMIPQLNERQREAVKELGFGSILSLQLDEIPHKLGRWLVESVDVEQCGLRLTDGVVRIMVEDVERVLELPRGDDKIVVPGVVDTKNEVVMKWRKKVGNNGFVSATQLKEMMLKEHDGGYWFRLHFLVLYVSLMMSITKNGAVNMKILPALKDLDKVKNYDWCAYLLKCLIANAQEWQGSQKCFTGPLTFLALFYCEICDVHGYNPERTEPILGRWTTEDLKNRVLFEHISGGFGKGILQTTYLKRLIVDETAYDERTIASIAAEPGIVESDEEMEHDAA